jgi:hypothetical protein
MNSAKGRSYMRVRSSACLDDGEMAKAANMEVHNCRFLRQVCYQERSRKAGTAGVRLDFELAAAVDDGIGLGAALAAAPGLDSEVALRLLDITAAAVLAKAEVAVHSLV